jgi:hypothetical protein
MLGFVREIDEQHEDRNAGVVSSERAKANSWFLSHSETKTYN